MSQKKNKLAIFDIDGTLTDTVEIHQSAFVHALNKFGLVDFDTNWSSYKHHTDSYIFKTIFENQFKKSIKPADLTHFETLLFEFILEASIQNPIKEIEGAKEFLTTLKLNSNFDIVFATGSLINPAKFKLEQAGIMIPENLIISTNQIYSRDELVLKAIETAKAFYSVNVYEQIISFGDGKWDYETSKNINIDFIGINNIKLQEFDIPCFYDNFSDNELFKKLNLNKETREEANFQINPKGIISEAFLKNGITTFKQATQFIQNLPYGRNPNKLELTTLFKDNCGTCSTKHAILKQLSTENNFEDIKLFIGLFKMNRKNTPEISKTLNKFGLEYIPEAHNYLKYKNQILDFTKPASNAIDFINELIEEIEILPHQISDFKVNYHLKYLEKWLSENIDLKYTLDEIWVIREQCIQDLSNN